MHWKENRAKSMAAVVAIYIVAALLAIAVFQRLPGQNVFVRVFVADTAATVFVYLLGLALRNASVYDPYWSVAPLVALPALAVYYRAYTFGALLFLVAIAYWGVRLTLNWVYTFQNLLWQDWRYTLLRQKTGLFFPLVSFLGIHYVPTLVVYAAMLPGIAYLQMGAPWRLGVGLGCTVCVCAATLQLVADRQMHRFRRSAQPGQLIRTGLWQYARHPNYLGEILMWWGVFAVLMAVAPGLWPLGIGAVANTLLFVCISIPLADARYRREKPGYEEYHAETRMLLPFKKPLF